MQYDAVVNLRSDASLQCILCRASLIKAAWLQSNFSNIAVTEVFLRLHQGNCIFQSQLQAMIKLENVGGTKHVDISTNAGSTRNTLNQIILKQNISYIQSTKDNKPLIQI